MSKQPEIEVSTKQHTPTKYDDLANEQLIALLPNFCGKKFDREIAIASLVKRDKGYPNKEENSKPKVEKLKVDGLLLENDKLKFEIEKLKFENEKLKFELSKYQK